MKWCGAIKMSGISRILRAASWLSSSCPRITGRPCGELRRESPQPSISCKPGKSSGSMWRCCRLLGSDRSAAIHKNGLATARPSGFSEWATRSPERPPPLFQEVTLGPRGMGVSSRRPSFTTGSLTPQSPKMSSAPQSLRRSATAISAIAASCCRAVGPW